MVNRGCRHGLLQCVRIFRFSWIILVLFKSNDLSADWLLVNSQRCHWEDFFMNDVAKKSKVNDVIKNSAYVNI